MGTLNLKPAAAPVKAYYATLQRFARGRFDNEGNIRGAFEDLLKKCARQFDWTLVPEYQIPRKGQSPIPEAPGDRSSPTGWIRIDAALVDSFNLPQGYWEAKDGEDPLEAEMKRKFEDLTEVQIPYAHQRR